MKPPPFDYVQASTVDDALDALAAAGEDAKVLAGGQSLIPLLSLRLAHPTALIDLNRVTELTTVERSNGELRVGAMVRHRTIERSKEAADAVPLLAQSMPLIGHLAIRSRGTIGGSLAHADPAAELPAVATALGATFTARSKANGERTIAAEDFFLGYFTTALEPDEILTDIRFPATAGRSGYAVEEVARRHGDFAMVGAVAAVTLDAADDTIADVRVALINVADRAMRATAAEQALTGTTATASTDFAEAADLAARDLDPSGDLHASPAYRKKVAGVCVKRALARATAAALQENK